MSTTDRIEKTLVLNATRAEVWRAISSAEDFGAWFGVKLDGPFAPGARVTGRLTIPNYDHLTLALDIERMDRERLFSYRWHPYAVDPNKDYSTEPTTLVEFTLEDAPGGTKLTVVESGFDRIPADRRAEAFRMNEGGWTAQVRNIDQYVARRRAAAAATRQ